MKNKNQNHRVRPLNLRLIIKATGVAFFLSLFLFNAEFATAADEKCEQCKYLRCLKSTVERKQRLVEVYKGLQKFWEGRNVDKAGKPIMEFDVTTVDKSDRASIVDANLNQLSEYGQMEESRTQAVPPAEGCGYPKDVATPSTNNFTCETTGVLEAREQQPCKELGDLIAQHEGVHQQSCEQRKKSPNGKILTAAGKAAGEIAAYQLEINAINKIIQKLEKKCGKISFKGVTIDCVIRTPKCSIRTGQKLEGHACGDPVTATWTINPKYFAEGCGMPANSGKGDKPFSNDCVEAGSDIEKRRAETYRSFRGRGAGGWMCVYTAEPKPKITIRNFRIAQCEGAAEQTITVDAELSKECDESSPPSGLPPAPLKSPPNS